MTILRIVVEAVIIGVLVASMTSATREIAIQLTGDPEHQPTHWVGNVIIGISAHIIVEIMRNARMLKAVSNMGERLYGKKFVPVKSPILRRGGTIEFSDIKKIM